MQQSRSLIGWVDPRLEGLQRPANPGGTPGLSRAISHRTGLDLTLVRALFVLLTLSTGVGVALYAWGTLLSQGAGGRRPIDSLLPAFPQWSLKAQALVVAVTTAAFLIVFGQWAPLNFVVAVVILILVYASTSRARRNHVPPPSNTPAPPHAAPKGSAHPAGRAHTVDDWRAAMAQAANRGTAWPEPRTLPEIDLYGPQPSPGPPPAKPKASWGAATAILLSGALAFAVGLTIANSFSIALGLAAATMGALTLFLALFVRGSRVPRTVLAIMGAVSFGAVSALAFGPSYGGPAAAPYYEEEITTFSGLSDYEEPTVLELGRGHTTVDLSAEDLTGYTPFEFSKSYEIHASDATITLKLPPGTPEMVYLNDDWVTGYIGGPEEGLEDVDMEEIVPLQIQIFGDNVEVQVLGGRPVETMNLGSGVTTTVDLSNEDLNGYSVEDPLHYRINASDARLTLRVPVGMQELSLSDEQLIATDGDGAVPLRIQVLGDNVELTIEEGR